MPRMHTVGVGMWSPGKRWRRVVNVTTRPPYPRERNSVTLEQEAGRAQTWYGRFGGDKSLAPVPDNLVATPSALLHLFRLT